MDMTFNRNIGECHIEISRVFTIHRIRSKVSFGMDYCHVERETKKKHVLLQHTSFSFYSFDINNESKSYVRSLFTASFPLIHAYVPVILVSLEAFVQSNDTR